jgi:predicted branched-subunit amino acid permease
MAGNLGHAETASGELGAGGGTSASEASRPGAESAPARGSSWRDPDGLRAGIKIGIPYAVAALLLAISFGVLAEPVIGATATIVSSGVIFAGSAQFASTAVLAGGGGAAAAIVAGILLNARYLPMGIALAPSLRGRWPTRAAMGQAMIDFSWAAASKGGGRFDPAFMVGATLPAFPAWVGGTAIGVFAGDAIGDPAALGLDVIFPAFFLALLFEGELTGGKSLVAAGAGALVALALVPVTPAGVPVIAASAAALIGLRGRRRSGAAGPDDAPAPVARHSGGEP